MKRRNKPADQMTMFPASTIPPARSPESDSIYLAVLYLRTSGRTVYRAGHQKHLVDGRVVSTPTLRRLAA